VGGQTHVRASSPLGKRLDTAFTAGWAPGTALTDAIKFASVGIRSPDRPTRSAVAIPTMLTHIYIYILYPVFVWRILLLKWTIHQFVCLPAVCIEGR
jgi:hypothetical protein